MVGETDAKLYTGARRGMVTSTGGTRCRVIVGRCSCRLEVLLCLVFSAGVTVVVIVVVAVVVVCCSDSWYSDG